MRVELPRRALVQALICASSVPLRTAAIDDSCGGASSYVVDTANYLPADELSRLERILQKGQEQTGVAIRVLTRSRASDEWTYDPASVKCKLGIDAAVRDNSIVLTADRGIQGALEAGSSFLNFQVGRNIGVNLPDVFFARLRQEYGRRSFVEARGEAASVVTAVELILTCLRSEEGFCTTVPPACLSKGCIT